MPFLPSSIANRLHAHLVHEPVAAAVFLLVHAEQKCSEFTRGHGCSEVLYMAEIGSDYDLQIKDQDHDLDH